MENKIAQKNRTVIAFIVLISLFTSSTMAQNKVVVIPLVGDNDTMTCSRADGNEIDCSPPRIVKLQVGFTAICGTGNSQYGGANYAAPNGALWFLSYKSIEPRVAFSLTEYTPNGGIRSEIIKYPGQVRLQDSIGNGCEIPVAVNNNVLPTDGANWSVKPVFTSNGTSVTLVEIIFERLP